MATARRAYTSEYTFNFAPEVQPERVRRTRQRPEKQVEQPKRAPQSGTLSQDTLRALIVGVLAMGVILIAMVIVNAHTASLQYDVNQLESQNEILQSEVDMLEVKIGSNTSINQLEEYAAANLAMHYPEGNECIHLATVELPKGNLADIIREKAYE